MALEQEIDVLVYSLYGLTADEIKVVEESAFRPGARSAAAKAST